MRDEREREREITGIGGKGEKKRRETLEKRGWGKIFNKKKKRIGKRSLVHTSKVWRRVST